jgi:ABC-type polar amino acid transport system ATPase subunit
VRGLVGKSVTILKNEDYICQNKSKFDERNVMPSVEKQIDSYLSVLSPAQKKTVLSVVKTIAEAQQDYGNIWDDENFVKEMANRTADYENGNVKMLQFEEVKKAAISNYKAKRKSNK